MNQQGRSSSFYSWVQVSHTCLFLFVDCLGLKMQWTPEHAQWAEQHFDISSTTRSPAHKAEAYRGHLQRTYQYAWANDDISALTASNLLKKYAEKYSGILEGPSERALLCSYSESAPGLLNGRKSESEAWHEGIYPMSCAADVVSASKTGITPALPPPDVTASVVPSSLSEPSYSSSNCGNHASTALHSGIPSQEFASSYNGSYLHSTYSGGQSTPALPSPHPSPLHSAGLLQPPPPPTLVPSYNASSPNLSSYNYPPAGYPPQTAVAPGYSPGGAPPPSAYLPSGIAAPTPLPPSTLPGYSYQSHNHAPIAPTPLNGSSANTLKRKAFYMTGQGDMDSSYGNFNYSQQRSAQSPMYRMPDNSLVDSTRGNGFDRNADTSSLAFKPTKQSMPPDQQRKFSSQSGRALTPPSYGSSKGSLGSLRPGESFGKFGSPILSDHGDDNRQHHPHSIGMATSSSHPAEEQLKNSDASLVEMVTTEILQQTPLWTGVTLLDWRWQKPPSKMRSCGLFWGQTCSAVWPHYLAASFSLDLRAQAGLCSAGVWPVSLAQLSSSLVAPHWSQNGLERARRSSRPRSLSLAAGSLQWFSSAM